MEQKREAEMEEAPMQSNESKRPADTVQGIDIVPSLGVGDTGDIEGIVASLIVTI